MLFVERDVARELRNGWRLVSTDPLVIERGRLRAVHDGHDFDEHAIEGALLHYELDDSPLDGVTWADWDAGGRLLAATDSGRIEIRQPRDGGGRATTWAHDLNGLDPDPVPPPDWAERW